MKIALAILALTVFALSLWADHKWRQWMKNRRSSSDSRDPHSSRATSGDPQNR